MALRKLRLDHDGMEEVLKSDEVRAAVHALAAAVAEEVDVPEGIPVSLSDYTTDRAATAVDIKHASGMARQAKYGTLTRAAAALGLEVRESE